MHIHTEFLNRTVNKSERPYKGATAQLLAVVWHETGGLNRSALTWNLKPNVRSSYNYHIDRAGQIDWYVDETVYVAWHAGAAGSGKPSICRINGKTYRGYLVNQVTIGIEIEGMNDGTPITAAQRDSGVWLAAYINDQYGIPLDMEHHFEHSQVAPGYKHDCKGYSAAMLVELAREVAA